MDLIEQTTKTKKAQEVKFQDTFQKGQKQIQVITPEYAGVQLKME